MRRLVAMVTLVALASAACVSGGRDELVVSAAASLGDVFEELALIFEEAHPDVDVVINLGGSSTLREQILAGSPADVFASASESVMASVVAAGLVEEEPSRFATNRLVVGVPAGNPANVRTLADLADAALLVGLCAETVPCGALASVVADELGLVIAADTREPDVRALVTKLGLGELDAGLVYASDAAASPSIDAIATGSDATTTYVIGVIAGTSSRREAGLFVDLVLSETGRDALARAGFGMP